MSQPITDLALDEIEAHFETRMCDCFYSEEVVAIIQRLRDLEARVAEIDVLSKPYGDSADATQGMTLINGMQDPGNPRGSD